MNKRNMRKYPLVYVAGSYARRQELLVFAAALVRSDILVRASWLSGIHDGATPDVCREHDLLDIQSCDVFLVCGEGSTAGGKFWEAGFAEALGKRIYLVGVPEEEVSVFSHGLVLCPELSAEKVASYLYALPEKPWKRESIW